MSSLERAAATREAAPWALLANDEPAAACFAVLSSALEPGANRSDELRAPSPGARVESNDDAGAASHCASRAPSSEKLPWSGPTRSQPCVAPG